MNDENLEKACDGVSPFLTEARRRLIEAKEHSKNLGEETVKIKAKHQQIKRAIFESREHHQLSVRLKASLNDLRSSIVEEIDKPFSSKEKLKEAIFLDSVNIKR